MDRIVLDASAILAALQNEPGQEHVRARIHEGLISSVNQAEAVSKLIERGAEPEFAMELVGDLECLAVSADAELGLRAGALHARTKGGNISLGDRFCLALAQREDLPVMTADRAWATLDLGIEIVLIR